MAATHRTTVPPAPRSGSPHRVGSLYERVLGSEAAALHPQVAALHSGINDVRAEGWMHVARGRGRLGRFVAAVARLPRPGTRVLVGLAIARDSGEERWVRQFGNRTAVVSLQAAGAAGELFERFGPLTFVFDLETDGDLLRFRQRACEVRVASLVAVIPRYWAPHVAAVVGPAPHDGVAVSVRIRTRWTGPLLSYEGTVAVQEPSQ